MAWRPRKSRGYFRVPPPSFAPIVEETRRWRRSQATETPSTRHAQAERHAISPDSLRAKDALLTVVALRRSGTRGGRTKQEATRARFYVCVDFAGEVEFRGRLRLRVRQHEGHMRAPHACGAHARRRDNPASSRFHRSAPNRCASRLIEAQRAQWSSPHLQRSAPFGSEQSRGTSRQVLVQFVAEAAALEREPDLAVRPGRRPPGRRAPRASLACRTSSLAAPLLRGHATAPRRAGAAHRARTAAAGRRARAGRCGDVLFWLLLVAGRLLARAGQRQQGDEPVAAHGT